MRSRARPQEDIDTGGAVDRVAAVRAWRTPPDVVPLNWPRQARSSSGGPCSSAIGIEAGVFTLADAHTLLRAPWARRVHRILVEVIFEHDDAQAVSLARAIDTRVAPLDRPRLWHGDARATWAVVDAGVAAGRDARVGLEDTLLARDGTRAPANAEQVAQIFTRLPRRIRGGCLCGGVRYEVSAPFRRANFCHCSRCRKHSGAAALAQGRVPASGFALLQGRELLVSYDEPGHMAKVFCARCGSSLFGGTWPAGPEVSIRLGTLDDDPEMRPGYHSFVDEVPPWDVVADDGLRRYPRRPPRDVT